MLQNETNVCSATYARLQRGTARIRRPHAAAAEIDISCPPGSQQQTCSSRVAAVGPCWSRRTDRQTDTVLFYRPCPHTVQAVPTRHFRLQLLNILHVFVCLHFSSSLEQNKRVCSFLYFSRNFASCHVFGMFLLQKLETPAAGDCR